MKLIGSKIANVIRLRHLQIGLVGAALKVASDCIAMRKLNQPKALNDGKSLPRSESQCNGCLQSLQPASPSIAIGSNDQHHALHV
jgi:hypothetical protein